jgi:hypothetical protein
MKYLLLALSLLFVSGQAFGEEKEQRTVITMRPTTVVGNPQRPLVSIEVSKVRMQLGATTPTLAAGAKIEGATRKDPF